MRLFVSFTVFVGSERRFDNMILPDGFPKNTDEVRKMENTLRKMIKSTHTTWRVGEVSIISMSVVPE